MVRPQHQPPNLWSTNLPHSPRLFRDFTVFRSTLFLRGESRRQGSWTNSWMWPLALHLILLTHPSLWHGQVPHSLTRWKGHFSMQEALLAGVKRWGAGRSRTLFSFTQYNSAGLVGWFVPFSFASTKLPFPSSSIVKPLDNRSQGSSKYLVSRLANPLFSPLYFSPISCHSSLKTSLSDAISDGFGNTNPRLSCI